MAVLPSIKWVFGFFSFFFQCATVNSAVCNSDVYGTIDSQECLRVLLSIPIFAQPSDPQFLTPNIFAEPQFMDPPFGGINNIYRPTPVIQLPKIWKYKSCRIAIMSEGRPSQTGVVKSQFSTSWKNIEDQMNPQLNVCMRQAKGGYVPLNLPGGDLGAAIYMYSSDSNWNIMAMNTYMSTGFPLLPHPQEHQIQPLGNISSFSQFSLLSNHSRLISIPSRASAVSVRPLAPGELVLLDES